MRQAQGFRRPRSTSPKARLATREADLQRAVVHFLRLARPDAVWFHVPNGGHRDAREAAIFQGLGVRAGVADLVFAGRHRTLFIELKIAGGRLSGVQAQFAADCQKLGLTYEVCTTVEEVQHVLRAWGLLGDGVSVGSARLPFREAE